MQLPNFWSINSISVQKNTRSVCIQIRHRIRLLRALILGCHLANSNDGPPSHPNPTEKWRQKKTLRIVPFFVNVNVLQTKTHSHMFRKKYWLRLVGCYVFSKNQGKNTPLGRQKNPRFNSRTPVRHIGATRFQVLICQEVTFGTDVSGTFGSIQPISMNKHARSSFWPLCSLQQVWGQKFKQVFETTYPYQL